MFIFETENRLKLSSHKTGQINDSGSYMKRADSSLVYGASSLGETLLTAIPKQLTTNILVAKPVFQS